MESLLYIATHNQGLFKNRLLQCAILENLWQTLGNLKGNNMKKLFIGVMAVGVSLVFSGEAFATNGHQFIGIGAYQKSMGGAVTAAPNGPASAISNPAGLAVIEEKAEFSFEGFMPTRSTDFSASGGESSEGGSDLYLAPSVGWSGKVEGHEDLYFGGGMFLSSGMGVDYDTIASVPFGAQMGDFTPWNANLYSQYQFWKLAPAVAKKINDNLSVGVSLNVDYQQMAFKQMYFDGGGNYFGADLSRASGALGFGATVGVLYKVSDMIQLGATYISEQSFGDMEYRLSAGDILFPTDNAGNYIMSQNGTYKMAMNFPQQAAIGVAITPTEGLTITADYKWINFSSTHEEVELSGDFITTNPFTGAMGTASVMPLAFGWEDVSVIAVGASFAVNENVTLHAGYNHGNSPIGEEDVFNNLVFPAIVEDHAGVGVDVKMGAWGVTLAYMSAFSNEIEGAGDMMGSDSGTKISLEEQSMMLSISHSFGG